MNDNVVDFNQFTKRKEEERVEEEVNHFLNLIEEMESEHKATNEVALTLTHGMCEVMLELGIPIDQNPNCIKDILAIATAVKGLVYRANGQDAIFHEVSNMLVKFESEDEMKATLADFLYGDE